MNRILLVYASKTGTTQDVALEVAKHLPVPCDVYNCREELLTGEKQAKVRVKPSGLNWDTYEVIIIGTAMYMRSPMKEIILFCKKNLERLIQKNLALFSCGIETETEDKDYLWEKLPEEVTRKVLIYRHLGGEIRENQMNAFLRLAMREYVKKNGESIGINYAGIKKFTEVISKMME